MQRETNGCSTISNCRFGFPVVAVVGLGYFIYYVWKYINNEI